MIIPVLSRPAHARTHEAYKKILPRRDTHARSALPARPLSKIGVLASPFGYLGEVHLAVNKPALVRSETSIGGVR